MLSQRRWAAPLLTRREIAPSRRAVAAPPPGRTAEEREPAPSRHRTAVTAPPGRATTDAPRDRAIAPPSQRYRIEQTKGRDKRCRAAPLRRAAVTAPLTAPLPTHRKIVPSRRKIAPRVEQPKGRDQCCRAAPLRRLHRAAGPRLCRRATRLRLHRRAALAAPPDQTAERPGLHRRRVRAYLTIASAKRRAPPQSGERCNDPRAAAFRDCRAAVAPLCCCVQA